MSQNQVIQAWRREFVTNHTRKQCHNLKANNCKSTKVVYDKIPLPHDTKQLLLKEHLKLIEIGSNKFKRTVNF